MKKIVFVCTGNTCRSPMAEIILKSKLKKMKITGYKVTSCGVCCEKGSVISENSKLALQFNGYSFKSFTPKQATTKILGDSFLTVTMTDRHKEILTGFPNVYSVSDITGDFGVVDPYNGSIERYLSCLAQLEQVCDEIIKKLLLEIKK